MMQASYLAAQTALETRVPWLSAHIVRVPLGFVDLVCDFLAAVTEIYPAPAIHFLRIITVSSDEFACSFVGLLASHPTLNIYIEPKGRSHAKQAAIDYHVEQLQRLTARKCYHCGAVAAIIGDPEDLKGPITFAMRHIKYYSACSPCFQSALAVYHASNSDPSSASTQPGDADSADTNPAEATAKSKSKSKAKSSEQSPNHPDELDDFELDDDLVNDEDDDETSALDLLTPPLRNTVPVFCRADVDRLATLLESEVRDQKVRLEALVRKPRNTNNAKALAEIPPQWQSLCAELSARFPNCNLVVEFIRNQCALSALSDQVFRLPPFMLVGPPGVGKTAFLLALAEGVNSSLTVIDIANAQTGSTLTGSESYWSNTQPGKVFHTLVFGDIANPLFLLDEVDKKSCRQDQDPLAGLHGLLEQRQAQRFTDLSVRDLPLDASHIVWCATANEERYIEKSLLDRFAIFRIGLPSVADMDVIVRNQYQYFITTHAAGSCFEATLDDAAVIAALARAHPRQVKKLLAQAFALAAMENRTRLCVKDVVTGEKATLPQRTVGFV